ncbi:uncharacterized protein LOC132278144 [Cornus florida]|uniref:uncharacterized protein LOC132278144 n=1 Tax=Cornus florida TaxID=4283 RepID=UPI0028984B02|nr:uncharacterized protein LOC132278144 [Cornus florida]
MSNVGGVSLMDIAAFARIRKAAITRYIWDLLTDNSERVWIGWYKTYLIKDRNIWALEIPQSWSWSWRKLLHLRHSARHISKHHIGNGTSTCFWNDNWLPLGPLSLRFQSHLLSDAGFERTTTVSSFITNNSWHFPTSLSRAIPELLGLPAPIKHTLAQLSPTLPRVPWFNLVWHSPAIPHMRFNLWSAVQGRLPTLDKISMARHQNECPLCNASP